MSIHDDVDWLSVIDELRTGRTRITEALRLGFADSDFWTTPSQQADTLRTPGAFSDGFPDWAKQALADLHGLTAEEIAHMEEWPHIEQVREAIVAAFDKGMAVDFAWELHSGVGADTRIDEVDGDLAILLRTPRSGILVEEIDGGGERLEFGILPPSSPAPED